MDRAKYRLVIFIVGLLACANVVILLYNAGTLSIWDDEANGYFLASQPVSFILHSLHSNMQEDPPLFSLLLHPWIKIAGRNVLILRLLPIFFWILTMLTVYPVAKRLGNDKTAWMSLFFLVLIPYNWIYPASLRWYSLFAFLAMLNFLFFLRIRDDACEENSARSGLIKPKVPDIIYYTVSGILLSYTNYLALLLFASHLVILLILKRSGSRALKAIMLSWVVMVLAYLVWIPVLVRQVGQSVGGISIIATMASIYSVIGEFSSPFVPVFSICCGLIFIISTCLVMRRLKDVWVPLIVVVVLCLAMSSGGTLLPKRMLLFTPFVALVLGRATWQRTGSLRLHKYLWVLIGSVYILIFSVSLRNMLERHGWISYRWLDPSEAVSRKVSGTEPKALVITDSNPVMFYLGDKFGCYILGVDEAYDTDNFCWSSMYSDTRQSEQLRSKVRSYKKLIYVHTSSIGPFDKAMGLLKNFLDGRLFSVDRIDTYLEVDRTFLYRHPNFTGKKIAPQDHTRIVVTYLSEATGD